MKEIKIGNFRTLVFDGDYRNCKFSTFDNVQGCLNYDKKETIEAIKDCVQDEVTWFVTLNDISYVNILEDEFDTVYIQKVPIGYRGGYQYHCLFFGYSGYVPTYEPRVKAEKKKDLLADRNLNKIMKYKSKTWLKKFLKQFNYG